MKLLLGHGFLMKLLRVDHLQIGCFDFMQSWKIRALACLKELMRMSSTDFILLLMVIFHACYHLLRRQSIGERHLIFFQNWSLRCGLLWYFWHGFDVKNRLCLIVRLGLACTSLSSHGGAGLLQAVVSQVEHGILHLADPENPRITVLVDCEGLTFEISHAIVEVVFCHFPRSFPGSSWLFVYYTASSSCSSYCTNFFPSSFLILVLKPVTQQKLMIEGRTNHKALVDSFKTFPSFLGGYCTCKRCSNLNISNISRMPRVSESSVTVRNPGAIRAEDMMPSPRPSNPTNMQMNGYSGHIFQSAMVGILIFWVLITFVARIYDPEFRPTLPF